jgi:hypothetical protein
MACFVSFCVLFVYICVLNYCHRLATQFQLNISYKFEDQHCENLGSHDDAGENSSLLIYDVVQIVMQL